MKLACGKGLKEGLSVCVLLPVCTGLSIDPVKTTLQLLESSEAAQSLEQAIRVSVEPNCESVLFFSLIPSKPDPCDILRLDCQSSTICRSESWVSRPTHNLSSRRDRRTVSCCSEKNHFLCVSDSLCCFVLRSITWAEFFPHVDSWSRQIPSRYGSHDLNSSALKFYLKVSGGVCPQQRVGLSSLQHAACVQSSSWPHADFHSKQQFSYCLCDQIMQTITNCRFSLYCGYMCKEKLK